MFDSIQDLLEFFGKEKFKTLNIRTGDLVNTWMEKRLVRF